MGKCYCLFSPNERKKSIPLYVSESSNDVRDHLDETLSPAKRFRGTFGSWFPPEVSAPVCDISSHFIFSGERKNVLKIEKENDTEILLVTQTYVHGNNKRKAIFKLISVGNTN
ncbi:hypothetical protein CEXT_371351 [Caerostris extrusa]|uniref:Uncharacterized protein n=1 Tax=Caerostris extrusa TaxID=172846 RepID=A0AAV4XKL5_CAEEX|nr:hypothetical protein CEXT_371351 [Caerostris extrusa]